MIHLALLSMLFSLFLIGYLLVWFSGDYDNLQYTDTYRVFVTFGLAFSYVSMKKMERTDL